MNPLEFLYETVDILKDGKNGKVSLVYDKVGKQFFVMKERDLKTAALYERLQNIKSPYLPEIYRTLEFDGKFFIVEEFIKGRTLQDFLTYNNGLDEEKSAEVLKQLCNCLKILHAQKIIHRDIKPSNVMLTENNSVKLIDFSISRIAKDNAENDTDFLGTKGYAPPEQFGFTQTDSRSDIYSLGVTIQKILGENYDGYLKNILAKCTELDPAKRYQSTDEILADVDKKYFRYKMKKAAVKISATCATSFLIFMAVQNFKTAEEIPAPPAQIQPPAEVKAVDKTFEKVPPRETPKKIEWAEIKMPATVNFSINPTVKNFEINTPADTNTVEDAEEEVTDPRLNRVCTLTFNGKIYHSDDGEISPNIWKTWRIDGEIIYLPENYSVSLNVENKAAAPLNVTVTANLKGLQKSEKVFTETIAAATSKNFEIPLGGMACNGKFEVEIWLRENGEPLFGIWNNKDFNTKGTVRIFLKEYNKRR